MQRKFKPIVPMIATALLAAIAVVLYFLGFPLFPGTPAAHLKLDFTDIPALVAALFFGPVYGIAVNLIQNLIGLMSGSFAMHLGFGNIMNFTVGAAFVVPYAVIVRRARNKHGRARRKDLVLASAVSIFCIVVIGLGMNIIFTPLFFRCALDIPMTVSQVWPILGFSTALNAIKGLVLSGSGVTILRMKKRLRLI